MPVQRAEDVLNECTRAFLEDRVGEDQIATYSVAQVSYQNQCGEHGSTLQVVWQISIHLAPVEPDSKERGYRLSVVVPYEQLDDGDTDWLEGILDKIWEAHTFELLMGDVDLGEETKEPEG